MVVLQHWHRHTHTHQISKPVAVVPTFVGMLSSVVFTFRLTTCNSLIESFGFISVFVAAIILCPVTLVNLCDYCCDLSWVLESNSPTMACLLQITESTEDFQCLSVNVPLNVCWLRDFSNRCNFTLNVN